MARFIETHWVTCKGDKRDRYGRIIAVCFVVSNDLNAMMVREGWALALPPISPEDIELLCWMGIEPEVGASDASSEGAPA